MQKKRIASGRLYLQNFVLVAIPAVIIVCVSLFLFQNIFNRYARDYESLYMENALNQSMSTFDRINNDLTLSVNYLSSSDNVRIFLMNDSIIHESAAFQRFINTFNSIAQSSILANSYIEEIAAYSEANHYLYSTADSGYIDRLDKVDLLSEYEKDDRRYRYLLWKDGGETKMVFFAPVAMYGVSMGAIIVYFDYEELLRLLRQSTFEYFQISDANDKIVLCSDIENIGKPSTVIEEIQQQGSFGKYYSLASDQTPYSLCTIANAAYTEKVEEVAVLLFRVMLISIICMLILTALVAVKVYFPIKKISDFVLDSPDTLASEYPTKYKKEYEFIIGNIQNTLNHNLLLREQLSDKLEKLNKMHMVALQAQINPHFLYNTLQMIGLYAEEQFGSDENTISNSMKLLSNLMQVNFSTQNPLTTLKVEIQHLLMYYHLQRELYGDMINVEVKIPRELDGYAIPKITLQPILENAVQYGVKPSGRACTVTVAGELTEDKLDIYVLDDGVGIEEEVLKDLRERMSREDLAQDSHIGLCNINQRIKLIFGQEYGITIESSFGTGTRVRITLPAKEMKEIVGEKQQ